MLIVVDGIGNYRIVDFATVSVDHDFPIDQPIVVGILAAVFHQPVRFCGLVDLAIGSQGCVIVRQCDGIFVGKYLFSCFGCQEDRQCFRRFFQQGDRNFLRIRIIGVDVILVLHQLFFQRSDLRRIPSYCDRVKRQVFQGLAFLQLVSDDCIFVDFFFVRIE